MSDKKEMEESSITAKEAEYFDLDEQIRPTRKTSRHAPPFSYKEESGRCYTVHLINLRVNPFHTGKQMPEIDIPHSLRMEHDELHQQLEKAINAGGKVGDAAIRVAELLHPHFLKEEQYTLPPLGWLYRLLPAGHSDRRSIDDIGQEDIKNLSTMTDKLKEELLEMLKEHRDVVSALDKLINAAREEEKLEHIHFAEELKLHAQTEEEVLYPAAVLIGEYVKMKSPEAF